MNFFQKHTRLTTVGVILIAAAVFVTLYFLSLINKPSADSGTTAETATAAEESSSETGGEGLSDGAALEQYDFRGLLALGEGQQQEQVITVDIDGDGTLEALILVRNSGDRRPLDWYLFDAEEGSPVKLFERTGVAQGELTIDGPRVIESEGIYSPEDDACCPSNLKRTVYVWKDGALVVSSVVAQPAGAPVP